MPQNDYHETSDAKIFGDLRTGLQKNLYAVLFCKSCNAEVGVLRKGLYYGLSVYCLNCVKRASVR